MERYANAIFTGIEFLSVPPDTHVIKATTKLGIINPESLNGSDIQQMIIDIWSNLISSTDLSPIDMHTPLWLWSRSGFIDIVDLH